MEQNSHNKNKRIMARSNILTSPDSNETFKMHTDDRNSKIGAVISQRGETITFYSRKRTDTKKMYTVTEKKLLIIV